jgi:DNA-directed RNA polymerase subunit RPC12/RpoP
MQTVVSCSKCGGQMLADPQLHPVVVCPHCQAHVQVQQSAQPAPTDGMPPTMPYAPVSPPGQGKATASLVLGLCSLVMWLCPIVGIAISIIGIVLGAQANAVQRRGTATAGIVCSVIGLVLSLANAALGAYFFMTGQVQPFGLPGQP